MAFTNTSRSIVRSGSEFISALLNPSVEELLLAADCDPTEAQWESSNLEVPALIRRNVTIRGDPSLPSIPLLRLNYVKAKIRLAGAVVLTLRDLVLDKLRFDSPARTPGMDLVVRTAPGEMSAIVVDQCFYLIPVCLPAAFRQGNLAGLVRPAGYPGNQHIVLSAPQVSCVNDTAAPLVSRCWPNMDIYADMVTPGMEAEPASGRPVPSNIMIHMVNSFIVCQRIADPACIAQHTAYGCIRILTLGQSDTTSGSSSGSNGGASSSAVGGGGISSNSSSSSSRGSIPQIDEAVSSRSGGASNGTGGGATYAPTAPGGPALSAGALAGAVLGAVTSAIIVLLLILLVAAAVRRRKQRQSATAATATAAEIATLAPQPRLASLGGSKVVVKTIGCFAHHYYRNRQGVRSGGANRSTTSAAELASAANKSAEEYDCKVLPNNTQSSVGRRSPSSGMQQLQRTSTLAAAACISKASSATDGLPSTWLAATEIPVTLLTPPRSDLNLNVSLRQQHGSNFSGGRDIESGGGTAGNRASVAPTEGPKLHPQGATGQRSQQQGQQGTSEMRPAVKQELSDFALLKAANQNQAGVSRRCNSITATASIGLPAGNVNEDTGAGGDKGTNHAAEAQRWQQESSKGGEVDDERADEDVTDVGEDGSGAAVSLLSVVRGKGAFGRVVEGLYGGQRVAVKIMTEVGVYGDCSGRPNKFVTSFEQEVQVLGRCEHPNIVRLLAACVTPPRLCLVMELMDASLDDVLYRSGNLPSDSTTSVGETERVQDLSPLLPLPKVIYVANCICRALAYLHPTIVHRDLKPANVLVNDPTRNKPVVKLSDFGLARLQSTVIATKRPEAGTPPYMAPECFDAENFVVTHKVDMYSLGVLLWEMLSGKKPWLGLDPLQIATQVVLQGRRPSLDILPPGRCPPRLRALLSACWERDPARRPAAAEAANELAALAEVVEATSAAAAAGAAAKESARSKYKASFGGDTTQGTQKPDHDGHEGWSQILAAASTTFDGCFHRASCPHPPPSALLASSGSQKSMQQGV